jgi:parallel beta-helix repeat protein
MALTKATNRMTTGSIANVMDFGAVGDGVTDDTAAIQAAIDASQHVVIPDGHTFVITSAEQTPALVVHTESTLEINGILLLKANSPDGVCMISNRTAVEMYTDLTDDVAVPYHNNITIFGTGKVDGNKANQYTFDAAFPLVASRHSCIQLWKGAHFRISVNEIGQNEWRNHATQDSIAHPMQFGSCVGMINAWDSTVSDVLLYAWEREGITIDGNRLTSPRSGKCYNNTVTNCTCVGEDSAGFSGIQVGSLGAHHNTITNCRVSNTGASAIGLDSKYSIVSNCIVDGSIYFHGINVGHSGEPSDYSVISNCSIYNVGSGNHATSKSHGITVANGTKNVVISNCNIDTVLSSGIYLSTATDCAISNCRIDNTGDHGIQHYLAHRLKVSNCIAKNIGLSDIANISSSSTQVEYQINEATVLENVASLVTNTGVTTASEIKNTGATYSGTGLTVGQSASGVYTSGAHNIYVYGGDATFKQAFTSQLVADASLVYSSVISNGIKIKFTGAGDGYWDGAADLGAADYAEYFEWADGNPNNEDRVGYSVSLVGNQIKIAETGEVVMGIVSARPAIVGDSASLGWQGKWEVDEFGRRVQQNITVYSWEVEEDIIEEDDTVKTNTIKHEYRHDALPTGMAVPANATSVVRQEDKPSADYDANAEYTPRSDRKEWSPVGLLGKLKTRTGQVTNPSWIKLRDISTTIEEWLVR